MKNRFLGVLIWGSALLISGCGSSEKAAVTAPTESSLNANRPSWVTNRPMDSGYYIGIAVASKTANPTSFALVAQRNALNEMASQIDVKVKSNSMLFSFEDNNKFNDEYKEFIQVKANQQLTNFEEVATWENISEYWVYYRLSKEQYQKDKQARINKATNMSINTLNQASKQWTNKNYKQGLKLMFEALNPIKPYLGEPLQVTLNSTKDVYLGNFIFAQISQGVRAFKIAPVNTTVETIWGGRVSSTDLAFNITDYDGNALSQIPVNFSYSEGIIRPREGVSNGMGVVSTEIKKISSTDNIQEVKATIDFEKMVLGTKRPDDITAIILKKLDRPTTSVNINVKAPSVFVISDEKSFGTGKGNQLKTAFNQQASKMGFRLASSKKTADLIATIQTDTKQSGISYDMYNCYLNGTVVITEAQTLRVVYQDKLSSIKGVSSSYKMAGSESYKKAAVYIIEKIVPRFYRKYVS